MLICLLYLQHYLVNFSGIWYGGEQRSLLGRFRFGGLYQSSTASTLHINEIGPHQFCILVFQIMMLCSLVDGPFYQITWCLKSGGPQYESLLPWKSQTWISLEITKNWYLI